MSEIQEKYEAGLCNIGKNEITIRKKLFNFSLLVMLSLICLSMAFHQDKWMTLLLFVSTFFTFLLFIEIRLKFCILFGFFNLYNFKQLGNLENVNDLELKRKDRKRAFKIVTLSFFVAAAITYIDFMFADYILG